MSHRFSVWVISFVFTAISLLGCGGASWVKPETSISKSFESGSIGKVERVSDTQWELSLADDNSDASLPATWRSWWYVKMNDLDNSAATKITLKKSGWPYFYLPVYSYDQKEWFQFSEHEVNQSINRELLVSKQFEHNQVWLARFYPYTFSDLKKYIESLQGNPWVEIQIPGYSQQVQPLYVLKITNKNVPVTAKKRVVMHARTHPAETSPSFLLEGLIAKLLSGTPEAAELLSAFEFHIFPMQNVDGVVAGNYRSTPKSENLEMLWTFDKTNPLNLTGNVPPEVAVIHRYVTDLMHDGGPPVAMALNLHASNSEPAIRTFFFPHFGPAAKGYLPLESSLWQQQLGLISTLNAQFGPNMIEPIPEDGGGSFATKTYPESWWWANYQDKVLAMTMEMTYGQSGYASRWIGQTDLRDLGAALVLGIRDFYAGAPVSTLATPSVPGVVGINVLKYPDANAPTATEGPSGGRLRALQYPQLYPPRASQELKD